MRCSLSRLFLGAALACLSCAAIALGLFLQRSQRAALEAAERSRRAEAARVEARVAQALGAAQDALENVERALVSGAVESADRRALEALTYTQLLAGRHVAEISFTEPSGRQLSVFRTLEGSIATRSIEPLAGDFVAWQRLHGEGFALTGAEQRWRAADPRRHPTFAACVAQGRAGAALWSDLHHAELDGGSAARVVLTVQQGAWDSAGRLLGVVRVGLLTRDLDAITETGSAGPQRIVLLALGAAPLEPARLVARVSPADRVVTVGDDLRIAPADPPPEVAELLAGPLVRGLDADCPSREGDLDVQGQRWLATLSPLSIARGGTAGWLVAVLVPESVYTRELVELARVLTLVFGVTLLIVFGVGAAVLGLVRRGLSLLGQTTLRMRDFDFAASERRSPILDIDELLGSLERAKTVTRALCKYIPVPLVRRLYEGNRDPELGGEPRELTLLFTDIQDFTSLSEQLAPEELARRLGRYFEVLTAALEASGATIDKYIGDAVMAFWNAPVALEAHGLAACRGILAAQAALAELYASREWRGLPPLVTRFGVHRTRALVGHFGAPSRLAYTALGDGVNLTSRLEGACKQYGVTVLVSASVAEAARHELAFRRVDRLIVQGKREAVDVYELLAEGPLQGAQRRRVQAYEAALDAYFRRDFAGARARFSSLAACDAPSAVLARRCERFEREPPPDDWNGAHAAAMK